MCCNKLANSADSPATSSVGKCPAQQTNKQIVNQDYEKKNEPVYQVTNRCEELAILAQSPEARVRTLRQAS